ncbi:MAG: hypothetical protein CFE21_15545 [Bacteroidetes bacterium B1(2017)]|nr:MAG: hypothetical protein CFE21_15545 [Bacteroidetes bacterium B1(2017)]
MCYAQDTTFSTVYKNYEYVDDITANDSAIFCAGYSFQTKINDGNACDAYLLSYDKTNLKLNWSLKVSDAHTNRISSLLYHNNKLYALVTQGKIVNLNEDVHLSLFVLNLNGEIEQKIPFGASFFTPSDMKITGNILNFAFQVSSSKRYSTSDLSTVVVTYNLATKKTIRKKVTTYYPRPKKILQSKGNLYVMGIYIHPDAPNLIVSKKGVISEIRLNAPKTEYFIDSYIKGNKLTIVAVFPGVYGDLNCYLKYYYINTVTNAITSKIIPYKTMRWDEIRFDTYSLGSSIWLIEKELKTKKLKYILLGDTGKILKSFPIKDDDGYKQNFIFEDNLLIKASNGRISIIKY